MLIVAATDACGNTSTCSVGLCSAADGEGYGGSLAGATLLRGDANGDAEVNLSDTVFVLGYLYSGAPAPSCMDAGDANDDGELDLSDGIYALSFLFTGGAVMPAPYPEVGSDRTSDSLGCASGRLRLTVRFED